MFLNKKSITYERVLHHLHIEDHADEAMHARVQLARHRRRRGIARLFRASL